MANKKKNYEKAITLMRWIRRSNENGTLLKISE